MARRVPLDAIKAAKLRCGIDNDNEQIGKVERVHPGNITFQFLSTTVIE